MRKTKIICTLGPSTDKEEMCIRDSSYHELCYGQDKRIFRCN